MNQEQGEPIISVVDGDAETRKSLRWLLQHSGVNVAAFSGSAEFLESFSPNRRGCIVAETRLSHLGGVALLRHLRQSGCQTPIIFHTAHGDVSTTAEAFREGAFHFLAKNGPSQKLLDAVQAALRYDEEEHCLRARLTAFAGRLELLSPGEREVVDRLVEDRSYKQIAAALNISYKTVEARRARAFKKLQIETVVQLVRQTLELKQASSHCRLCGDRIRRIAEGQSAL